ncbi:MAG: hypothetical protein ACI4F7_02395 [Acutalibacteraceae bacterium]
MKRKIFGIIKLIVLCIICCSLFVGGGYFYLRKNFKEAENKVSSVPYSFSAPESKGIMLDICGSLTFLYLDFEEERLTVIVPPEKEYTDEIFGYPVDFTVTTDYRLVSAIIDYADGIELNLNGETLRYTGVQVYDILSRTVDTSELKRKIITALLEKIGENGIDGEVFGYIIQNTETDLTVPDCYYWEKYIARLCKNGGIIN